MSSSDTRTKRVEDLTPAAREVELFRIEHKLADMNEGRTGWSDTLRDRLLNRKRKLLGDAGNRSKARRIQLKTRVHADTAARIDHLRGPGEDLGTFLRVAIERELEHRQREQNTASLTELSARVARQNELDRLYRGALEWALATEEERAAKVPDWPASRERTF